MPADSNHIGMRPRRRVGVSAALTTPFDRSGEIDWSRLIGHAAGLLDRGLTTLTLFGTTGEGASTSISERDSAFARFDAAGIAPEKLIAGVFQNAAGDAADQGRGALADGCAAILVSPPFYFSPAGDGALFDWYAQFIERLGDAARDVFLYNIPSMTGITISPALVTLLRSEFAQVIAGVKDSGGDFAATRKMLEVHGDCEILVGHEGQLAPAVALGASGSISGIANFVPELVTKLASGRPDERTDALVSALLSHPVVPAVKALVAHQKDDPVWARMRPPLEQLSDRAAASLTQEYDRLFNLQEA
jgi:4-hydroxy-tetrahydrodipicolinate synthase